MTEGTKNTVIGSVLATVIAALLAGVASLIHDQAEERVHSGKIDMVIASINTGVSDQRDIRKKLQAIEAVLASDKFPNV